MSSSGGLFYNPCIMGKGPTLLSASGVEGSWGKHTPADGNKVTHPESDLCCSRFFCVCAHGCMCVCVKTMSCERFQQRPGSCLLAGFVYTCWYKSPPAEGAGRLGVFTDVYCWGKTLVYYKITTTKTTRAPGEREGRPRPLQPTLL